MEGAVPAHPQPRRVSGRLGQLSLCGGSGQRQRGAEPRRQTGVCADPQPRAGAPGMGMRVFQPNLSPARFLASWGRTERAPGSPAARTFSPTRRKENSPSPAAERAGERRRSRRTDTRSCFLCEEREIHHQRAFIVSIIIVIIIIAIMVSLHINK